MKKFKILVVCAVVFQVMVPVFAEATAAKAKQIIGSWIDQHGNTWVFNQDGSYQVPFGGEPLKYEVTATAIAFLGDTGDFGHTLSIFRYSISSDGQAMTVEPHADVYTEVYLLTKVSE
ncbi:MAG: hypothetical protein Ta2A_27060 [Treponemataceae bacterium]|nr:MAG: hypothetical protein Ta2A_27060 [Treponemataceae bacterium]